MNTNPLDQLADLYADFAAHLLSIPAITALPGVAEWLGERMLYGFQTDMGFNRNPRFRGDTSHAHEAYRNFSYPDTANDSPHRFCSYMIYANHALTAAALPPFPRAAEIEALRPLLADDRFPKRDE